MELNENDYPMNYKEYEKRIMELLLETYPQEKREMLIDRLDKLLEEDPDFIKGLYGESCFRYDHPEIYGENCKKVFGDYLLESIPIRNLKLLLGGKLD